MFRNELIIQADEPFQEDRLNRDIEIEKLTKLFDIVGNQMVLAIDSPWGTGKSTFLNMWNYHLRNEEYKTIFFNAWENDFIEEPFIAFVSAIREELVEQSKKVAFTQRAQKVGTMLAKQSPKILAKVIEKHTGVDITEEVDMEGIEAFVGKQIDGYVENRNSLEKFKEELSNITKQEVEKTGKPIVIFIDELDRCKPTYAITLLERVKHILNVPNIVFVLGIDKVALSNSIRVIYGSGTDINGYLSRFVDMEYTLSGTTKEKYIAHLIKKYGFEELINHLSQSGDIINYADFKKLVIGIIVNFDISLRDSEKILANMYITMNTSRISSSLMYTYILMVVLRKVDDETYRLLKERAITTEELIRKFDRNHALENWTEDLYGDGIFLKGQLMWILNEENEIRKLEQVCSNNEIQSTLSERRLLEIINWNKRCKPNGFDERDANEVLARLAKQIELYDGLSKL